MGWALLWLSSTVKEVEESDCWALGKVQTAGQVKESVVVAAWRKIRSNRAPEVREAAG